ncbi:Aste57867_1269 [Aphanomyces stellatus]|uniref:Aste57867_1269 protein n=1 Tax=Aphanomyces stellatus TaxID=120398 RepID=A0A485K7G9_9STRA|nr:hypothetical protein As57867_001268 [Aphanomyces stellatus]VFT78488.1 Aste57867_1269 [Aphanomyces stellatus]
MWCAFYGREDCAKELLAHGANVDYVFPHDNKNAADVARYNNQSAFLAFLANYPSKGRRPPSTTTAAFPRNPDTLVHACKYNLIDLARACLDAGVSVHGRDKEWSPFMWAASAGNIEMGKLLIKHGANVEWVFRPDGKDAKDVAMLNNHVEFVDFFKMRLSQPTTRHPPTEKRPPAPLRPPPAPVAATPRASLSFPPAQKPIQPSPPQVESTAEMLIHACKYNKLADVRECLDAGLNVHGQGNDWSPFMWAAFYGHIEIAKTLLARGAKADWVYGHDGKNAMDVATQNNQTAFVAFLNTLSGRQVGGKQDQGGGTKESAPRTTNNTPSLPPPSLDIDALVHACKYNKLDDVRACVQAGVRINGRGYEWSPFLWAAHFGHIGVAKFLVEHGADVDFVSGRDGKTALGVATDNHKPEMVAFLNALPRQATAAVAVAVAASPPVTADMLIHACKYNKLDDVRMCLAGGLNVNGRGNDWSPLMWAAFYGRIEVAKLLVSHGADVELVFRHDGKSALDVATENKQTEFVTYLTTLGKDQLVDQDKATIDKLIDACKVNNLNDVHTCLQDRTVDVDGNGTDWSPLMWAAVDGRVEVATILLDHGAKVDLVRDGTDAMALAMQHNHVAFAALLKGTTNVAPPPSFPLTQSSSSSCESTTTQQATPELLIHGCKFGNVSEVLACLEGGVTVHGRDNDWSPLMWAAYYGEAYIVKILLEHGADMDYVFGHDGKTAMDCAVANNHADVVAMLTQFKGSGGLMTAPSPRQELTDLLQDERDAAERPPTRCCVIN